MFLTSQTDTLDVNLMVTEGTRRFTLSGQLSIFLTLSSIAHESFPWMTLLIAFRHQQSRMQRKNFTEVTEFIFLGFSSFGKHQITLFVVF